MKITVSLPLYRRLLLVIVLSFFVTLLIGFLLNQAILSELKEQQRIRIDSALIECQNILELELERVFLSSRFFMFIEESILVMYREYGSLSPYQLGKVVENIYNGLWNIKFSSKFISGVTIYFPNIVRSISTGGYYHDGTPVVIENAGITDLEDNFLFWSEITPCLSIKSPAIFEKTQPYYIFLEIDNAVLSRHLGWYSSESTIAIISDDRVILPENSDTSIYFHPAIEELVAGPAQQNGFIVQQRYSSILKSYFVSFIQEKYSFELVRRYQALQFVILIFTMIIAAYIAYYLVHKIRLPFKKLISLLDSVGKGDLDTNIEYHGNDEFSLVFRKLQIMTERLKSVINEKLSDEKKLYQAELKILQSQISPHFIYNSFNILRYAIHAGESDIAEDLVYRLSDYFRYMTYNDQDMIPLSDEYRFANDYLEIQKIRFREKVKIFIMPLPEKYHSIMVPRMILQPLIENVFKHGIRDIEIGGEVSLYNEEKEDVLKIFVKDNGCGMTADALEFLHNVLLKKEPVGEHAGLVNIYRRLHDSFPGGSLEIFNAPGGGFVSVVTIPMNKENAGV
jgi:two-component system sensor histidine kinase YesM